MKLTEMTFIIFGKDLYVNQIIDSLRKNFSLPLFGLRCYFEVDTRPSGRPSVDFVAP
jgi:hypothetical protein